MSKNIEINYKSDVGYEVLYPMVQTSSLLPGTLSGQFVFDTAPKSNVAASADDELLRFGEYKAQFDELSGKVEDVRSHYEYVEIGTFHISGVTAQLFDIESYYNSYQFLIIKYSNVVVEENEDDAYVSYYTDYSHDDLFNHVFYLRGSLPNNSRNDLLFYINSFTPSSYRFLGFSDIYGPAVLGQGRIAFSPDYTVVNGEGRGCEVDATFYAVRII